MQKLLDGLRRFMTSLHDAERTFFQELANGQRPETLFVTCSDSRVVPSLFTQTEPGDLFIIRNAGNIIPSPDFEHSGEAAAIEFAVCHLAVKDVVVCGHSDCGAMKGLVAPEALSGMPRVASWLEHAAETRRILNQRHGDLTGPAKLRQATEINVLVQLTHLARHPCVAKRLAEESIRLYGWVYDIGEGAVSAFDSHSGGFVPLAKQSSVDGLSGSDIGQLDP